MNILYRRPSVQYLKTILDPFKFVVKTNKTKLLGAMFGVFVLLFVYSIPGYMVKKILDALF